QAPLFSSLEENEFALVIKDQVITSSSNIEEIESYIDSILFDNVIPGLNMNHIKVFKRLSIKIGANIMEDYGRGKKSY
ncbi:MAG: hypothetical protein JNN26_26960, partial [Candidatus Obscuribacter sp.]|nr:hypothetical protein [Candidatus Obscuribacter sp.]